MTRDEAIELLELMRRQLHEEDRVAPLDPETLARAYVRTMTRRRSDRDKERKDGPAGGGDGPL